MDVSQKYQSWSENLRYYRQEDDTDDGGISLVRHLEVMGRFGIGEVEPIPIKDPKEWVWRGGIEVALFDPYNGKVGSRHHSQGLYLKPVCASKAPEEHPDRVLKESFNILLTRGDEVRWDNAMAIRSCSSVDNRASWPAWVHHVYVRFRPELSRIGIHGAVGLARYEYKRDANFFRHLLNRWCPESNTFHMGWGEVGISLDSMYRISGLPVDGDFYDEFTPFNNVLYSEDTPNCTKELFRIYNSLMMRKRVRVASDVETKEALPEKKLKRVSFRQWMEYFFTETSWRFSKTRHSIPSDDQIWDSEIPTQAGVSKEGYLAAFLSCWLCSFVLPSHRGEVIRPETFMMAGRMAMGQRHCLLIPVMANLYRELGLVVQSRHPGNQLVQGAFQYLFGWIGQYFPSTYPRRATTEADANLPYLIYIADQQPTHYEGWKQVGNMLTNAANFKARPFKGTSDQPGDVMVVDQSGVEGRLFTCPDFVMVMSLRSGQLLWRTGGHCYVEPYYPSRFGRQFGYDQAKPPRLELVRRSSSDFHWVKRSWNFLVRRDTGSEFYLPAQDRGEKPSLRFALWWMDCTTAYLKEGGRDIPCVNMKQHLAELREGEGGDPPAPSKKRSLKRVKRTAEDSPGKKGKKPKTTRSPAPRKDRRSGKAVQTFETVPRPRTEEEIEREREFLAFELAKEYGLHPIAEELDPERDIQASLPQAEAVLEVEAGAAAKTRPVTVSGVASTPMGTFSDSEGDEVAFQTATVMPLLIVHSTALRPESPTYMPRPIPRAAEGAESAIWSLLREELQPFADRASRYASIARGSNNVERFAFAIPPAASCPPPTKDVADLFAESAKKMLEGLRSSLCAMKFIETDRMICVCEAVFKALDPLGVDYAIVQRKVEELINLALLVQRLNAAVVADDAEESISLHIEGIAQQMENLSAIVDHVRTHMATTRDALRTAVLKVETLREQLDVAKAEATKAQEVCEASERELVVLGSELAEGQSVADWARQLDDQIRSGRKILKASRKSAYSSFLSYRDSIRDQGL